MHMILARTDHFQNARHTLCIRIEVLNHLHKLRDIGSLSSRPEEALVVRREVLVELIYYFEHENTQWSSFASVVPDVTDGVLIENWSFIARGLYDEEID